MEQTAFQFKITFKTWTIKELTLEKTTWDGDLVYDVRQEWNFSQDLTSIVADMIITVATDASNLEGSKIARLRLSADLGVEGLTQDVPKELFGQIGMILLHTSRGILIHAGQGTALAQKPVPMYTMEQMTGQM